MNQNTIYQIVHQLISSDEEYHCDGIEFIDFRSNRRSLEDIKKEFIKIHQNNKFQPPNTIHASPFTDGVEEIKKNSLFHLFILHKKWGKRQIEDKENVRNILEFMHGKNWNKPN